MFEFHQFDLSDHEIRLELVLTEEPDVTKDIKPRYGFRIVKQATDQEVGVIFFVMDRSQRQYLKGHISYGIHQEFRGHAYAYKACLLIKQVALYHDFKEVYIGAKSTNMPSIKTIQNLGACSADLPSRLQKKLTSENIEMYVWKIK